MKRGVAVWVVALFLLTLAIFLPVFGSLVVKKAANMETARVQKEKELELLVQDSSLPPNSAIYMAKMGDFETLSNEARSYGISIISNNEMGRYLHIRPRLENPLLKRAFLTAKSNGVVIFLGTKFGVGRRYVDVDVYASDKEIIDFLLGTQQQQQQNPQ